MMRQWAPVVFDATHASQRGRVDGKTTGRRQDALVLARAAMAVGVDAIFAEVHSDPDHAMSDSATQLPLAWVDAWLQSWLAKP